jgi:hypothetical protein
MTAAPISATAMAGSEPNKTLPDAAPLHAYATDGRIMLLDGGLYRIATRWQAVTALSEVDGSPFPSSQERARQIRAALRETMQ